MITTAGLIYYGISALVIVAGVWFLVKCPLLPKDEDRNELFWE